ncbi:MAG: hypothetical protein EOO24_06145 [Comamonadaceae bacterium]|nr:MAG: hypothetical protein EOO24_06145 [Comamonadaceae bacterium]
MEKIIVYVDDAAHARDFVEKHLVGTASAGVARHWILVGCPPRMTHRISKWVSHSARENWRGKWFAKLLAEMSPVLKRPGHELTAVLAKGALSDMTRQLRLTHGVAEVLDARRPRIGAELEPVSLEQAPPSGPAWALPGAMLGMGALLVLVNELSE